MFNPHMPSNLDMNQLNSNANPQMYYGNMTINPNTANVNPFRDLTNLHVSDNPLYQVNETVPKPINASYESVPRTPNSSFQNFNSQFQPSPLNVNILYANVHNNFSFYNHTSNEAIYDPTPINLSANDYNPNSNVTSLTQLSNPLAMYPPGATINASDEPYTPPRTRRTHPNCSTFYYNRKSSRSSSTDRSFYCTYEGCGKAYKKASHLTAHMVVHTGAKPFKCSFILPDGRCCTNDFARSDQLTRHLRKHKNEKKFTCAHCQKTFFRSDHRNKHQSGCPKPGHR